MASECRVSWNLPVQLQQLGLHIPAEATEEKEGRPQGRRNKEEMPYEIADVYKLVRIQSTGKATLDVYEQVEPDGTCRWIVEFPEDQIPEMWRAHFGWSMKVPIPTSLHDKIEQWSSSHSSS